MVRKRKEIPFSRMSGRSNTGLFFKHTSDWDNGGAMDFPHRDDYYILVLLEAGEARVEVDLRDVRISGGEGIVIVPGQVHFPKTGKQFPPAWGLFISPDYISENNRQVFGQYSLNTVPLKFEASVVNDISVLFEILGRHSGNMEFSRAVVAAIVNLFSRSVSAPEKTGCGRYAVLALRLKHLLEEKIAEEKSPGRYASMLNISEVYLNEAIRAMTGMNTGSFIRAQVVLNAKRLLVHTSRTVSEIAASLGYDDVSYFSRLFKREAGMTPTDFRKNLG